MKNDHDLIKDEVVKILTTLQYTIIEDTWNDSFAAKIELQHPVGGLFIMFNNPNEDLGQLIYDMLPSFISNHNKKMLQWATDNNIPMSDLDFRPLKDKYEQ